MTNANRRRVPVTLPSDPLTAREQIRAIRRRRRMRARRRTAIAAVLLLVSAALVGFELGRRAWVGTPPSDRSAVSLDGAEDAGTDPDAARAGRPAAPEEPPQQGAGTFAYATTSGPVHGAAGELRRFRVAVEDGAGQDPAAF